MFCSTRKNRIFPFFYSHKRKTKNPNDFLPAAKVRKPNLSRKLLPLVTFAEKYEKKIGIERRKSEKRTK